MHIVEFTSGIGSLPRGDASKIKGLRNFVTLFLLPCQTRVAEYSLAYAKGASEQFALRSTLPRQIDN